MRRGEVYWVRLDPTEGVEIRKTRPAIIISNDAANRALRSVTVVPLTTNVSRVSPSQAIVTVDGVTSKALGDQVRTVAKSRLLGRPIGSVPAADMAAVDRVLRVHLAL